MSMNKPSEAEEEYFAREESARRERETLEIARQTAVAEQERLKQLHYMKCPKCGFDLHQTLFRGVTIDKCYHCGGMWFDEKELDLLAGHREFNVFQTIVRLFKHSR